MSVVKEVILEQITTLTYHMTYKTDAILHLKSSQQKLGDSDFISHVR